VEQAIAAAVTDPLAATGLTGRDARLVDAKAGLLRQIIAAVDMTIPDSSTLLVLGEEGDLVDAGPEGLAFDAEGFDGVEVGAELKGLAHVEDNLEGTPRRRT
jgi:hypothetical protein